MALQPDSIADYEEEAIQPLITGALPIYEAIKLPNKTNKPPKEATLPPNNTSSTGDINTGSNENTESACYDPDAFVASWKSSKEFSSFLENNFRRKLSFDQVLDILETSSIPSVDALASDILKPTIVNQISSLHTKKYVQQRDKELFVQCSLINTTLLTT